MGQENYQILYSPVLSSVTPPSPTAAEPPSTISLGTCGSTMPTSAGTTILVSASTPTQNRLA